MIALLGRWYDRLAQKPTASSTLFVAQRPASPPPSRPEFWMSAPGTLTAFRLMAAIGCAIALAGCGGDARLDSEIEAVITTYWDGYFEGDGEKACSVMSAEYKREVTRESGLPDCATAMGTAADKFAGDFIALVREAVDEAQPDIQVRRSTATATFIGIYQNFQGFNPIQPSETTFTLEKTEGNWYITDVSAY